MASLLDGGWVVVFSALVAVALSCIIWMVSKPQRQDHVAQALLSAPIANLRTIEAVDQLAKALPSKVHRRGDQALEANLRTYWSAQEQSIVPECVVTPKSTKDVATIIKIISDHFDQPNEEQLHFAVRSGGHAPSSGSANAGRGITVDLSALNEITLCEDHRSVLLGPAARWGDVYETLELHELVVAGGRAAGVGVAGLTLGGGISFFSPRCAFVCDNIVEYEVVLANGSVVIASASENQDLFIALKGGSNNFGIVTKLVARTFPQGKIAFGYTYHLGYTIPQHIQAFYDFCKPDRFDEYAGAMVALAYDLVSGLKLVVPGLYYTKPVINPPSLKPILSIPRVWSTWKIRSVTDAANEVNRMSPLSNRQFFRTTTFSINLEMLHHCNRVWSGSLRHLKSVARSGSFSIVFQPLPPVVTARSHSNNVMGLHSKTTLVVLLLNAVWKYSKDDQAIHRAADELFRNVESVAKQMGLYHRYKYLNYASGQQDPMSGYGDENREKLQAVSRKYDPNGLFQRGCVGGFKVF